MKTIINLRPNANEKFLFVLLLIIITTNLSCNPKATSDNNQHLFSKENLIAWCIVPFDASMRGPEERAVMLNELGFTKMAWDWRPEHVPTLSDEIRVLRENDIELSAVWFNIGYELKEGLSPDHELILNTLFETKTKTTLWVTFSGRFFDDKEKDEDKIEKAARNIRFLNSLVEPQGIKIALYNHMGWFGEPGNQISIINAVGSGNVGIVYNFHHGHHHIDDFPQLLEIMFPHLWTINLNGMNADGPKILDFGAGEHDTSLIKLIIDSGFKGTIGILGHTQGEDIKEPLTRNLEGLKKVLEEIPN